MAYSKTTRAVLNALEGLNRNDWALLVDEIDQEFDRKQREACGKVTLEVSDDLEERVGRRLQMKEMLEKL